MQRIAVLALIAAAGCDRVFDLQRTGDDDPASDGLPLDATSTHSLIARFPMDEVSMTGTPEVVRMHASSCAGTCPQATSNGGHSALDFAGRGEIQVLPSPDLGAVQTYTVAAWVRASAVPTSGKSCPISKLITDSIYNTYQLCLDTQAHWNFYSALDTNGGLVNDYAFVDKKIDDNWHHVALSWDGTRKTIYLDGAMGTQHAVSMHFDADAALIIGGDRDDAKSSSHFTGFIDDVRIYDYALAQDEIDVLAAAIP